MRSCGTSLLAFLVVAAIAPVTAQTSAFDPCLQIETPTERVACLVSALAGRTPPEQLALLTPLVNSEPESAALILEQMKDAWPAQLAADSGLAADRLDLLGQARMVQGRAAEAADAFSAAVALDDGTLRLDWRNPGGATAWSRALGLGNRRIERAVNALVAAKRPAEALPLIERARSLGAGEWARQVWPGAQDSAGGDRRPSVLDGPMWREPLPDLEVRLFGGRKTHLRDARGKVLLLDFWASWCQPCVRELPFIEELYQSRGERGLEVLAINYHESPQEAIAFAMAMGLTVPVGAADREIEAAFEIKSMPTVILADRAGRIRGRWAGYEDNVEAEMTDLIDELLSVEGVERIEVGHVLEGEGALTVDWIRVARREVESVRILQSDKGPRLAVAHARALSLFDPEGREDRVLTRPAAASVLRVADLNGDGVDELIGFRPGSRGVFVFDIVEKTFMHWESPHPVFDIAAGAFGEESRPAVVMGTIDGLWRADADGASPAKLGVAGTVSGLGRAEAPLQGLIALESGVGLHWLDRGLTVRHSAAAAARAWTLVADPRLPGAAAAPVEVTAAVAGSFLRGGDRQVALALGSGQLVLVDAATGEPRFRAAFEGTLDGLAGGDLDGDGLDELVVLQGRNLILMRAGGRPAPNAEPGVEK